VPGASHSVAIPVRWSESDPAGIAFYPKFFEWFDIACAALFDGVGLPWPVLFPQRGIVGVPIVECGARFIAPVRWGDTVTITATIAWVREKMFRVEYAAAVGDRACATGFEVRAWVGRPATPSEPLRALPIPDDIVTKLSGDAP
jgi:4-hydroxybenzoyl-CoA thioesterase